MAVEAVKNAIRSALERGDPRDRAFREQVYRQTFSALDRSLRLRSDLSAQDTQQRREQVKAAIVEIEREYLATSEPSVPPPSKVPPQPIPPIEPIASSAEADFVPRVERQDRPDFEEGPRDRLVPDGEKHPLRMGGEKRRRPSAGLLLLAILIVGAAIAAWWAVQTDFPSASDEQSTAAPERPSADTDWITVFSAEDPTAVDTSDGASAQIMSAANDTFLRIGTGSATSAVSINVGQDVLDRIAGERAVFSLTARSEEGQETQISVTCDFGAFGNCRRARYVVGALPTEYLFEVDLPDRQPSGSGTISIRPDVEGRGRTLDIFSLRVRTEG